MINSRPTIGWRQHYMGCLTGKYELPPHIVIGPNCSKNHGVGDKGVRYKKNGRCPFCSSHSHVNTKARKNTNRLLAAERLLDDIALNKLLEDEF